MHREIDPLGEKRLIELGGEERNRSDPGDRDVLDRVAGGADRHQLGPGSSARKQRLDPVRLPERQWAPPSAETEWLGHVAGTPA